MAVRVLVGRHRDAREGSLLAGNRGWGRAVKESRHREFAAALTTAAMRLLESGCRVGRGNEGKDVVNGRSSVRCYGVAVDSRFD